MAATFCNKSKVESFYHSFFVLPKKYFASFNPKLVRGSHAHEGWLVRLEQFDRDLLLLIQPQVFAPFEGSKRISDEATKAMPMLWGYKRKVLSINSMDEYQWFGWFMHFEDMLSWSGVRHAYSLWIGSFGTPSTKVDSPLSYGAIV